MFQIRSIRNPHSVKYIECKLQSGRRACFQLCKLNEVKYFKENDVPGTGRLLGAALSPVEKLRSI